MPTGPSGEKRPADVIANAELVGRIDTGDAEETHTAKALTPEHHKEIAQKGAKARWG